MAMAPGQKNAEVFHATGSPADDTNYEKLDFGFKANGMKISVTAGSLELSFDGKDDYGVLAVGEHDFSNIRVPRLFVKGTGATAQIWAWADQ